MNAAAKGHMRVGIAGNVHILRVLKGHRIAVGGVDDDHHLFALADFLAAQLNVVQGNARRPLDRRIVPQQFLGGAHQQAVVLLEHLPLLRVPHQGHSAVAHQVDGSLVARNQQQQRVAQHFLAGQFPLPFPDGQNGQQVVGGFADPPLHQRVHIVIERGNGLVNACVAVGGLLIQGQQLPGKGADEFPVGGGHSQPVGDDQHRHCVGEILEDIHSAAFGVKVPQQVLDDVLHHHPEAVVNVLGVEHRMHGAPHPQVVGPVAPDEPVVHIVQVELVLGEIRLGNGRAGGLLVPQKDLRGKILGMAQRPDHSLVRGHDPSVKLGVPIDRRLLPQGRVVRVGVPQIFGRQQLVVDTLFQHRHRHGLAAGSGRVGFCRTM